MAGQYPLAAGYRDIGSTTMGYTPTLYSGKLIKKLYKRTVFGAIANTDYESEIKNYGDSVVIRSLPDISVRAYSKGQSLVSEQPESTKVQLNIDQGFYWDFQDEDVELAQTDLKNYVEMWTDVAARKLQIKIDETVLAGVYADAHASNYGATAGAISGDLNLGADGGTSVELDTTNVLTKIIECGQVLDEQDVDPEGRWMVIPSWMYTLLLTSDLKNAMLTGDAVSPIRNYRAGKVGDFTLYRSNQVPTSTDGAAATAYQIMFGTRDAIAFATQLVENKRKDNPFGFGMLNMGLQVFGYKVVLPEALGVLYAKKA